MNYKERERQKAIEIRDSLFRDPGQGVFFGKKREFVLDESSLNLWEGIRVDAFEYFKRNEIPWWKGEDDNPTGHLLSSQVACVNHLYYLRQREDLANAILQNIDNETVNPVKVDDGYVEFEYIGPKQYLSEKSWKRGANCTSVDAVMASETASGGKKLFFIEWKYTESYSKENKYIKERAKVYDNLIKASNSPFKDFPVEAFYYEPFYQLMRQTLLAWQIIKDSDNDYTDYKHIHVIPDENKELLNNITSPYLSGRNISEAWKSALIEPEKFITISPSKLLNPCYGIEDSRSFLSYLEKRYWL